MRLGMAIALGCVAFAARADQIIAVAASAFDRSLSEFNVEIKGNKWIEVADPTSLTGVAYTCPGDNNFAAELDFGPALIYKLPVAVKPGESTNDGKKWQIWFHMRVPTDRNSFYWQLSSDAKNWVPTPITNANRVNDDAMNFSNKWYWQDQETGNAGAATPTLVVGTNWLRVAVREADVLPNAPLFDVVVLRNYGQLGPAGAPNDAEVKALLAVTPIEPRGKAAITWGTLKTVH